MLRQSRFKICFHTNEMNSGSKPLTDDNTDIGYCNRVGFLGTAPDGPSCRKSGVFSDAGRFSGRFIGCGDDDETALMGSEFPNWLDSVDTSSNY